MNHLDKPLKQLIKEALDKGFALRITFRPFLDEPVCPNCNTWFTPNAQAEKESEGLKRVRDALRRLPKSRRKPKRR